MKDFVIYLIFILALSCVRKNKPIIFYSSQGDYSSGKIMDFVKDKELHSQVEHYDVYVNKSAHELMVQISENECGLRSGAVGVPLMFYEKKCLTSEVEIVKKLKNLE